MYVKQFFLFGEWRLIFLFWDLLSPPCKTIQWTFIVQEKAKTEEAHEKAVVVSQWTSMLNILKHHIIEQGLKFTEITGQVMDNMSHRGDARLSEKLSFLLILCLRILSDNIDNKKYLWAN